MHLLHAFLCGRSGIISKMNTNVILCRQRGSPHLSDVADEGHAVGLVVVEKCREAQELLRDTVLEPRPLLPNLWGGVEGEWRGISMSQDARSADFLVALLWNIIRLNFRLGRGREYRISFAFSVFFLLTLLNFAYFAFAKKNTSGQDLLTFLCSKSKIRKQKPTTPWYKHCITKNQNSNKGFSIALRLAFNYILKNVCCFKHVYFSHLEWGFVVNYFCFHPILDLRFFPRYGFRFLFSPFFRRANQAQTQNSYHWSAAEPKKSGEKGKSKKNKQMISAKWAASSLEVTFLFLENSHTPYQSLVCNDHLHCRVFLKNMWVWIGWIGKNRGLNQNKAPEWQEFESLPSDTASIHLWTGGARWA